MTVPVVGPVWNDAAKRVVYGVASVPGELVSAADIEKAAHDYLARYEPPPGVNLVESYIAPVDLTVAGHAVAKGSWVLGTRVSDPVVWERIQKGESAVYTTAATSEGDVMTDDEMAPAKRLANAMQDLEVTKAELAKNPSADPRTRANVAKAGRDLQMEYLHSTSPSAAARLEERRAWEAKRGI